MMPGRFLSHPFHFITFRTPWTVQGLSKALGKFQECITHIKTRKNFNKNRCPKNRSFRGTAPTFARPRTFRYLSVGTVYSVQTGSEETINERNFKVCHTIRNRPGTCERVRQSVRALNYVGDFLSICCELWLGKD